MTTGHTPWGGVLTPILALHHLVLVGHALGSWERGPAVPSENGTMGLVIPPREPRDTPVSAPQCLPPPLALACCCFRGVLWGYKEPSLSALTSMYGLF